MDYNLITILGPTAVGKTKLAVNLASKYNGEIISADSRQVYRGMDIGTGKDLSEYNTDAGQTPHHLIDIIDPTEEFDLFQFNKLFYKSFEEITERRKLPFLVGGTGLYLHSILSPYNLKPVDFNTPRAKELNKLDLSTLRNILVAKSDSLHNTTNLTDKKRMIKAILIAEAERRKDEFQTSIHSLTIGVRLPREQIKRRITERLKYRLQNGMIDEVNDLLKKGVTHDKLQFFGLEYKFISDHLKGELNYNDMFQKLNSAIHNFAKRQMTWFRKMEREGIEINWIDGQDVNAAKKIINDKMKFS